MTYLLNNSVYLSGLRNLSFKIEQLKIFLIIFLLIFPLILSSNIVVAQDSKPKVLFDETGPDYGKFFTIYNIGTYGSSGFAALLEANGYSVSKITDKPITTEKLKGYDVLVLFASFRNYSDDEVNTIKEFVNNGGGLYLVGTNWGDVDGDQNFAFNKIAKSFGVSFANNEIVTDTQHYIFFSNFVIVNNVSPNPVTNNVSTFYYFMGTYIKDTGNSTVVAYTDADSWGDQGYTTPQGYTWSNYQKDFHEQSGPLPIISEMNYGKGKVVFMGAAFTFANSFLYRGNGWKLGLNTVNWLANRPAPSSYQPAGMIPYNIGDMWYRIIGMFILAVILFSGLIFKIRRDKISESYQTKIETIKNWKFRFQVAINAIFMILAGLLFIPINFYLFDITQFAAYDPNLGYALITTGILYLLFMGITLYNIIARQVIPVKYNYFNIVIILLFAGLTILLGDIFGFPYMQIFTVGGMILLIPLVINLWFHRSYGQYLIIEGKEFDRLEKLSANALLYEFRTIYTDLDYLGEGGFGRVFKAVNKKGQKVAIKIPKTFDKRAERTFITEVSNWSHLDHPNIVKLYDFKILPIPYIETEYCDDILEKGMKPLKEAVNIIYEVAKGLQYAHNKHIIHGDIKFSNILIKDGVYKISDWGLSKLKTEESLSLSGATPSYAAPEQISHDFGKADERTDIYQLGTVFYAILTGEMPFKGDVFQIYTSTLTKKPVPPVEINANAQPVSDIIMKCLNKNKEDRYSSMEELIKDLKEFMENETALFGDEENPEE
ncbi:MAG: serine/threonine-protein kinase [Methanobacterium sp. PtaU1.Bin097]|nr:MAG: serine/threonine-protein kinase [Methanobacterium sp. PtaU1.Bin097]